MSNKLIVKNSVFLYVRLVTSTIISLLASRYTLSALGAEDYGIFSVVGGVANMMAFVNTVMVSTTYRFIAVEMGKKDGDVNRIFNTSLNIHILISVAVLILSLTIGVFYIKNYLVVPDGRLNDALIVFVLAVVQVIFVIVGTPFQGFLVAKEKFSVTVPIEIISKGLILALVILLNYLPGNRLVIYSIFFTITHAFNPILYMIYCFKSYFEEVRPKLARVKQDYLDMMKFSGWIALGAGASLVEHQGSALIINRFFGAILNASFGIANKIRSLASMFANSLGQAIAPQITKSYSGDNEERSMRLVAISSKYSFFLMLIPLLPIMLEIDFVLSVWLTEVPPYTANFVLIMLIQSLITSIGSGISTIFTASGKLALFNIVGSITALISLPLAYVLFKLGYPPYSISYIYASLAFVNIASRIVMMHYVLHYSIIFFFKEVIWRDFLVLLITLPSFLIPMLLRQGWGRLFLSVIVSEVLLLISIFFVGMDDNERKLVLDMGLKYFKKAECKDRNENFIL